MKYYTNNIVFQGKELQKSRFNVIFLGRFVWKFRYCDYLRECTSPQIKIPDLFPSLKE